MKSIFKILVALGCVKKSSCSSRLRMHLYLSVGRMNNVLVKQHQQNVILQINGSSENKLF